MQTFLPFPDFQETAQVLDWHRLGKQRVEAVQILKVLENPAVKGWRNHPAVIMWRDCSSGLKCYFNVISTEWIRRGYRHNIGFFEVINPIFPDWLGDSAFHCSHRSNLIRKDPKFYQPLFPDTDGSLPYIWPSK